MHFHQGYLFNPLIFSKLTGTLPNTPPPLCTLHASCSSIVHCMCPVSLCTPLVRTKNWPARHFFLYTSPEIKSLSAFSEEMCTEKRPHTPISLYTRAVYKSHLFPLSELFLIFAVRSAPSRTGHRPGGEMVDTRDLKSLGPKRPCGFDSRPGHRKDFVSC